MSASSSYYTESESLTVLALHHIFVPCLKVLAGVHVITVRALLIENDHGLLRGLEVATQHLIWLHLKLAIGDCCPHHCAQETQTSHRGVKSS